MRKSHIAALFVALATITLNAKAHACVTLVGNTQSSSEYLKSFKVYRHRFDRVQVKSICGRLMYYEVVVTCKTQEGKPPYRPASAYNRLEEGQTRNVSHDSVTSTDATCNLDLVVEDKGGPNKKAGKPSSLQSTSGTSGLDKKIEEARKNNGIALTAAREIREREQKIIDAKNQTETLRKIQDLHRKCDIAGNASIDNGFTIDGDIVQFFVWDPVNRQTVLMTFNRQEIGAINDNSGPDNLMVAFSCRAGTACVSANGQRKTYAPLMRTILKCPPQELSDYKNLLHSSEFQDQFGIKPQTPGAPLLPSPPSPPIQSPGVLQNRLP